MKKMLLLFSISLLCNFAQSQTTYAIINLGSVYSQSQLESAIGGSSLCGFYYKNIRRKLVFDDGAIIELFMESETQQLQSSCFVSKPINANDYDNTWEISDTGHLIRRIAINVTK